MTAGEMGADYVMFGEPQGGARTMSLASLAERVAWWAEIFETPCVAYADRIDAVGALAEAGADFVALGNAIWDSSSPARAVREAQMLIARVDVSAP
jgi:thiamine-phosphate pyrophosphorylase